ncbi:hypothetical protein BaRGS_00009961, partial [Batillaria attramentaria]
LKPYPTFSWQRAVSELSQESFRNRLPVVIYLLTLIAVGFFGNVLVILVYVFRFQPSATRSFVLGMAVCDLLTSVVGLPLQLVTIRYAYDTQSLWLCRGMFAAATLPTQSSGVILNVVAVDRYRRICTPHNRQISHMEAWKLVAASVIITSITFSCFIPLYGIHTKEVPGVTVSMCWLHDAYKDTIYPKLYNYVVFVVFYVGLSVMLVAYTFVGVRLWQQNQKRKVKPGVPRASPHPRRKSTRTRAASRTNLIMATLTVCYVINWLPHLIVRLPHHTEPELRVPQNTAKLAPPTAVPLGLLLSASSTSATVRRPTPTMEQKSGPVSSSDDYNLGPTFATPNSESDTTLSDACT